MVDSESQQFTRSLMWDECPIKVSTLLTTRLRIIVGVPMGAESILVSKQRLRDWLSYFIDSLVVTIHYHSAHKDQSVDQVHHEHGYRINPDTLKAETWFDYKTDNETGTLAEWVKHEGVGRLTVLGCGHSYVPVSYTHLTLPTKRIV